MNKHIYFLLILFNKNYNKHFLKRYVKLALFFKDRNFKKAKGLHHHHIIPDSFDGAKSNENMVYITPREHFILHWMLYKAFPKSSMVTAFFAMCSGFGKMDFRINSKVYENLALEFVERQSETGRKNSNKRVKDGTHNFLSGEFQRKNNLKRVADGTHNFLGGEIQRENAKKQLENGTHHFLGGEIQGQNSRKRVADGTHHFLGGEISRKSNKKRVEDGTHHFFDKEKARERANKSVADGTNPFLIYNKIEIECEHCKRTFFKRNYKRWHGDKCKLNPNKCN